VRRDLPRAAAHEEEREHDRAGESGEVILDHTPGLTGGHYAEQSYGFAYMKALKNRASSETV